MSPRKVQCEGLNKSGYRCRNKIKSGKHCMLHSDQDPTTPPRRRCGAATQQGARCSQLVSEGTFDRPLNCRIHRFQPVQLRFITCFGKEQGGQRCKQSVPWKAPYFQFCSRHHDQAAKFGCPISKLPNEITSAIFDKISAVDRVAFAMANKSCAETVRSWGENLDNKAMVLAADFTYVRDALAPSMPPFTAHVYLQRVPNPLARPLLDIVTSNGHSLATSPLAPLMKIHKPTCKTFEFLQLSKGRLGHLPRLALKHVRDQSTVTAVTRLGDLKRRMIDVLESHPFLFPKSFSGCLLCGISVAGTELSNYWFCEQCDRLELYVPWCESCCGEFSPLALARTFYDRNKRRVSRIPRT